MAEGRLQSGYLYSIRNAQKYANTCFWRPVFKVRIHRDNAVSNLQMLQFSIKDPVFIHNIGLFSHK